ncbi:PKD domain-containing protein [Chitinophaga sp. Mgbs1]|uniref:PKD domain-containing protein n=1 Tax=Chitinophaga solisilvae TaxID=1233460 RepID=A0A9Q5CZL3_9BACT|nr:PKD domain-containing protein [Chitinophaga solisilvae]
MYLSIPTGRKFVISVIFLCSIILPASVLAQLKADFSFKGNNPCESAVVQFTDLSTGTPTSWLWDFGNGYTSTAKNPATTYYAKDYPAGKRTFTVKLTIKDASGTSNVVTKDITPVYPKPKVDFSISSSKGCIPFEPAFTYNPDKDPLAQPAASFTWDFGDGSVTSGGSTISHMYDRLPGVYPVTLTVTDVQGCTNYKTINDMADVAGRLTASFNVPEKMLCREPVDVFFTNTSSGPGTLKYKWEFDDGTTSALKDPGKYHITAKGTHSISLTVTNERNCKATHTVSDINVANYKTDFTAPALICTNSNITITPSYYPQLSNYDVTWEVNGQYYWSGSSAMYLTPNTAGPMKVKLTARYGACQDVVEKTLTVNESPSVNLDYDRKPFCQVPVTLDFKADSKNADKWQWSFGDGSSSAEQNPKHTFSTQGSFHVNVTATNKSGCSSRADGYVYVSNTTVEAYSNNTDGCEGLKANYYAYVSSNSNDEIKKYTWNFGDGTPASNEASPQHEYSKAGVYRATLTYETKNGCTGVVNCTNSISVYKKPTPEFTSPDAPTVCGNSGTRFIDQSDIGNRWEWQTGDGRGGSGKNYTHSYLEPGTYDITLTVYNHSCSNTITKKAYITTVNPFPRFYQNSIDCDNRTTLSFTEASLGATSWTWSWGDGKSDTSYTTRSNPIKHIYDKSGVYTVKLTTSDGKCTTFETMSVRVIAPSPLTITANKTVMCSTDQVTATLTQYDRSILDRYQWYANGEPKDWWYNYNTAFTYPVMAPGKVDLQFYGVNLQGCIDKSNIIPVTVRGPVANYNMPSFVGCRDREVTFTDASDLTYSSGIQKWEWEYGDDSFKETFTSPPFKHTYLAAGAAIRPRMKITDKDGCTSVYDAKTLQVNGPIAMFYPDNDIVAPGSTVYFYDQSQGVGADIISWQWDFGDGSTSAERNPNHTYPNKGLYTIILRVKDSDGCEHETTRKVKVSRVGAGFKYTYSFVNGGKCAPVVYYFQNTSINYATCFWDFGDGSTSTLAFPSHIYAESGRYKVILKVKGDADTEDETEEFIIVSGPYAEISASAEGGCLEKEITFKAKVKNAVSFTWDFTDGVVEQTPNLEISHKFIVPGIYKPRLIMQDETGCKGSAFLDNPIVIDKLDIKLPHDPAFICSAGDLTFAPEFNSYSIDELKKPGTYTWTYDPSLTPKDPTPVKPVFHLDKTGKYDFSLHVKTVYGCEKTATATVNVYPTPVVTITAPDKACIRELINIAGKVTESADVTWKWDLGNGQQSTLADPVQQQYIREGETRITVSVMSKDGCGASAEHPLLVQPLPVINASTPVEFICLNNSTTFTAGGGGTYEWMPAAGLDNPFSATPVASPAATTSYQVKVTAPNGCVDYNTIKLRVVQPFRIGSTPDTSLCLGDKLPLRAWGTDFYKWEGAGLNNPDKASPIATITKTGSYTYKVTGKDRDGCFSDEATVQVRVNPTPTVQAGPDREIMAGVPLYLTASGTNDVLRWRWTPTAGIDCPYCATIQVTPNLSTTYTLAGENRYGCIGKDDITVHVLCRQSAIFLPNAFTPNQDGQNDFFYPKGKGVKEVAFLQVYDRWGTLVFEKQRFQINTPGAGWNGRLSNGHFAPAGTYIYFIQTICESGEVFSFKGNLTLIR